MKLLHASLAAFLLALPLAPTAHAAVVILLKLDGIEGESTIIGHANEISIAEVSFSVEQSLALKEAGRTGGGAGQAAFTPITVRKGADKASPQLFISTVLGKPIKSGKITFLAQSSGDSGALVEFFSITLTGITITKFDVSGANGDNTTSEDISLNYSTIVVTYTPPMGLPMSVGFDVKRNVQLTAP